MKNFLSIVVIVLVLATALSFLSSAFPGSSSIGSGISSEDSIDADKLSGLNISFLGDSISTYDGYSNNAKINSTLSKNNKYYPSTNSNNDLTSVEDTYWYQTIEELSLNLCVNNSCDASRVSNTRTDSIPSGLSRATELHSTVAEPDIIVVYIGTNDIANGVSLEVFTEAYDQMVSDIIERYASADVYVCTLLPEKRYNDDALLCSFNDAIKIVAKDYDCNVVDFYADSGITWDNYTKYTIDNLHPNAAGMDKLTECLVDAIKKGTK